MALILLAVSLCISIAVVNTTIFRLMKEACQNRFCFLFFPVANYAFGSTLFMIHFFLIQGFGF